MKKIRHLNSLQVFEAAAKFQNTTHAAEFLNISQSSVSYHIKKLEDDLGVHLFERIATGLKLTADGNLLFMHVSHAFENIQAGLDKLKLNSQSIRFAVTPMFASRWLSSKLGQFWETYPDVQLSFQNHPNNFALMEWPSSFADFGVQWGQGEWPDFDVTKLGDEKLVVVCSPAYQEKHHITSPQDVAHCSLLHVESKDMWDDWFKRQHISEGQSSPPHFHEDRHFQLSATINGLGVSLFAESLIQNELESGLVINPLGVNFDSSFAYFLIAPSGMTLSKGAQLFRNWIIDNY